MIRCSASIGQLWPNACRAAVRLALLRSMMIVAIICHNAHDLGMLWRIYGWPAQAAVWSSWSFSMYDVLQQCLQTLGSVQLHCQHM